MAKSTCSRSAPTDSPAARAPISTSVPGSFSDVFFPRLHADRAFARRRRHRHRRGHREPLGARRRGARARLHARAAAPAGDPRDRHRRPEAFAAARRAWQPAEERLRRMRGFTLIEVLVALAVIGVALLAGVRAAGSMAQTN